MTAQERYQEHIRHFGIAVDLRKEMDMFTFLKHERNKTALIKRLIREEMERRGFDVLNPRATRQ